MADARRSTDGPAANDPDAWDATKLPDWDDNFVSDDDFEEFAKALAAPDVSPSEEDLSQPRQPTEFITALNDWRPIHQRARGDKRRRKSKRPPRRGKDETREGWTYKFLKWPLLLLVATWLTGLGALYLLTRVYIWMYEHLLTWRGKRESLRKTLRSRANYQDWVEAAETLDNHLGNDKWKETDEYAYYDCKTIRRVTERLHNLRERAEAEQKVSSQSGSKPAMDELRTLVEACVKNNFAGYENPRLYSETYYGTKNLVQSFVDESALAVELLFESHHFATEDKRRLAKHLSTNFGRTALCLSGGATFAYYHFGLAKALLDADLLPSIITGTSGGALVAALLATRTNDELKKLLVPALAARITACSDPFSVWFRRWYATGARFDSVDWARRCSWFCRGSLTFVEAYERTGRILNVTCVPSDPHSPTILANYLTAPDCVIWSAVLASAAVPGILNPVVLMRKRKDGQLEPFSFGHKWKDGSLRTDIPLKSLNLHFNVNFSVVSQVNPHINLFFFAPRGTVGRPVTHRRGRGWRGGFLGSALESYLKLDLTKWLKVLRHLELLPRWMGQDWSEIWLQRFSGTITIWPKTKTSDFLHILSDPSMERLARMIHVGQHSAFPKLNFIGNRMKIEKVIEKARIDTRPSGAGPLPTPALNRDTIRNMFSDGDLREMLRKGKVHDESEAGTIAPNSRRYEANTTREREPAAPLPYASATPSRPSPKKMESNGSAARKGDYFSTDEEVDGPPSPLQKSSNRRRLLGSSRNLPGQGHSQAQSPVPSPEEKSHKRSGSLGRRLGSWFGSVSGSHGGDRSASQSGLTSPRSPITGGAPGAIPPFDFEPSWHSGDGSSSAVDGRMSIETVRPSTARRSGDDGGENGVARSQISSQSSFSFGSGQTGLPRRRRTSFVGEMARQTRVFFDDSETEITDGEETGTGTGTETDEGEGDNSGIVAVSSGEEDESF